ncbi:putative MEI5 protein [Sordaria sp. MPI-SDFR-AT-0083]|nr:putative MEI5 protein [Sordaria sp. MPI-SDFR-AT-0083]
MSATSETTATPTTTTTTSAAGTTTINTGTSINTSTSTNNTTNHPGSPLSPTTMGSPSSPSGPSPSSSSGHVDPTQAVDGLVRAMRDLTSDSNYKLVADVFGQFIMLKEKNERLSISHREVLDEYHRYRSELDDWKKRLEKEKEGLEDVIQSKVQEVLQLHAQRASLQGNLEDSAKRAAAAVENGERELMRLKEEKERELQELRKDKERELAALKEDKEKELVALKEDKEQELTKLREDQAYELSKLRDDMGTELSDMKSLRGMQISELEAAKAALEKSKEELEASAAQAAQAAAEEIAALSTARGLLEEWKAQAEAKLVLLQESKTTLEADKTKNEAEIVSLKETVATLEAQFKAVDEALTTTKADFESLKTIQAEKTSEIERLRASLKAAEEEIASLKQTVAEKSAEIEALRTNLNTEKARADTAEARSEDLQSRLDETEDNLQTAEEKLDILASYQTKLHADSEDVYVDILDKIWTSIVTLVESTFRPSLPEPILSDPSCWANLRNSPYLKHATQLQIPLPQSNSPAAKGMRISAVLAVLSRALHRHLFRPVYLLDDDDENLVKFLRVLEDENPARELHLRSTLLATMPERQIEQGARRVKTVVREVSWLVQHLLSALAFESFVSGLEQACKLACEQWMRIQLASMKIEPYFGPPYDDFDWQVLDLPEFVSSNSTQQQRPFSVTLTDGGDGDDGASTIGAGAPLSTPAPDTDGTSTSKSHNLAHTHSHSHLHNNHDSDPNANSDTPQEEEIDPDDILLVVWPSMCSVEDGDIMSITQGLVISKQQARPALEEVRRSKSGINRDGSLNSNNGAPGMPIRPGSTTRRGTTRGMSIAAEERSRGESRSPVTSRRKSFFGMGGGGDKGEKGEGGKGEAGGEE